jgi:hypothetical protein
MYIRRSERVIIWDIRMYIAKSERVIMRNSHAIREPKAVLEQTQSRDANRLEISRRREPHRYQTGQPQPEIAGLGRSHQTERPAC